MSDSMSSREIEDVLTSIRRLVAQDGGRGAEQGRLILTPAQRIGAQRIGAERVEAQRIEAQPIGTQRIGTRASGAAPAHPPFSPTPGPAVDVDDADDADDRVSHGARGREPGPATDPVDAASPALEPSHSVTGEGAAAQPEREGLSLPMPDFGQLEATIAELEAAVSASGEAWESENPTEDGPRASNVTELYGRLTFAHRSESATPEAKAPNSIHETPRQDMPPDTGPDTGPETGPETGPDMPAQAELGTSAPPDPLVLAQAQGDDLARYAASMIDEVARPASAEDSTHSDVSAPSDRDRAFDDDGIGGGQTADAPGIDDPADAAEAGDTVIDEAMLRALVAQIVREELHGQLGEKITLAVRKLVRSEIAKLLDERKFL